MKPRKCLSKENHIIYETSTNIYCQMAPLETYEFDTYVILLVWFLPLNT